MGIVVRWRCGRSHLRAVRAARREGRVVIVKLGERVLDGGVLRGGATREAERELDREMMMAQDAAKGWIDGEG